MWPHLSKTHVIRPHVSLISCVFVLCHAIVLRTCADDAVNDLVEGATGKPELTAGMRRLRGYLGAHMVEAGLGRMVASHDCPSTLFQIRYESRYLFF